MYGVIIQDNKILISPQLGIGHGLPGGGIGLEETAEEAVVREVKEETGYDVEVVEFADMRENFFVWEPNDPAKCAYYHSICLYYIFKVTGGSLSTAGFDESEKRYAQLAEWIDIEKINDKTPIASSIDFRPIVTRVMEGIK